MSRKNDNQDRQLRSVEITSKGKVKINFVEIIVVEPAEGEEASSSIVNEYGVKSPLKPHKDLLDSMKKLRKYGMEICEENKDSKALAEWTVSKIKIDGDIPLRQSRVRLTMAKEVKRTGKQIKLETPQTTMYGESEYGKAQEMSKLIEAVIDEVNAYLEGKGESEDQLPLFPKIELQTA